MDLFYASCYDASFKQGARRLIATEPLVELIEFRTSVWCGSHPLIMYQYR